jgi:hypothetical protein
MNDTLAQAVAEPEAPQAHPWTLLAPEHWQLLRLAPLAIDRNTGARPLRFAQLGRLERHSPAQSLLRLWVQFPEQSLHKDVNLLEVWADHRSKEVRFGPDRGVRMDPVNRGLGRFLLAQGIAWAQHKYAGYSVEGLALQARDALSDDTRGRRDAFLRAQGFSVEYLDPAQLKGRCSAATVADLNDQWHPEKVQKVDLLEAAEMLKQADTSIRQLENTLRKRDDSIASLKREDGTLRFSIACLAAFCTFQAGLLLWMAAR